MRCIRCHRTLKHPGVDGLGPTCFAKSGKKPIAATDRDLFGYSVGAASAAAAERVRIFVDALAIDAVMAVRAQAAAARRRCGVWA